MRWIMMMSVVAVAVWAAHADVEIDESAKFAAPQRIKVGSKFLGEKRYYPSPVLHDVDGDGKKEIVIGDLTGRVTVASADSETPMMMADGKPLKFHNW